jgi:hypothetical protein
LLGFYEALLLTSSTAAGMTNWSNITSPDGQITTITRVATIIRFGFTTRDNEAYTFEVGWMGYSFTLLWTIIAVLGSTYFLSSIDSLQAVPWSLRKVTTKSKKSMRPIWFATLSREGGSKEAPHRESVDVRREAHSRASMEL